MLNKNNIRELAYLVTIDSIKPIEGSDNCEAAVVNGWEVMVRKNTFKAGDVAIYFEIDSLLDYTQPEFAFMERYHGKVKTQKYTFGGRNPGFYSQGLLMSLSDFDWQPVKNEYKIGAIEPNETIHEVGEESGFLTERFNVKYITIEDRKRKGGETKDKYKAMVQRHPKIFKNKAIRKLYKTNFGKKLLYIFFGHSKKKTSWLNWVVKTDEERIENMPFLLGKEDKWIATEKIDGTSSTYTMKKTFFGKKYYVCSRNVVFDNPNKQCYYDTNVYLEIGEKYNMKEVLKKLFKEKYPHANYITIQGEIYGDKIQNRDYGLKNGEHDFAAFNLIVDGTRMNSIDMTNILYEYDVPCVPIVDVDYQLPKTIEELREYVDGIFSLIDFKMREGVVFRSSDATRSFKCVSPNYLIKYHNY